MAKKKTIIVHYDLSSMKMWDLGIPNDIIRIQSTYNEKWIRCSKFSILNLRKRRKKYESVERLQCLKRVSIVSWVVRKAINTKTNTVNQALVVEVVKTLDLSNKRMDLSIPPDAWNFSHLFATPKNSRTVWNSEKHKNPLYFEGLSLSESKFAGDPPTLKS